MADRVVRNVQGLLDEVDDVRGVLGDDEFWYRGQACAKWKLRAKLDWRSNRENEVGLQTVFKLQAPTRYGAGPQWTDHAGWFSLMQHHGLSTRLLDWSCSLLVAAFFAVRPDDNYNDGGNSVIWVLAPKQLNLKMMGSFAHMPLETERAARHYTTLDDSTNMRPLLDEVLAVVPAEVHPRMMVQHARFTLHGDPTALEERLDPHGVLEPIFIPSDSRDKLCEDLGTLGFTESTLFPDLDHLAEDLNRQYAKDRSDGT